MTITVRKMFFDIENTMDPFFVDNDPEGVCFLNAISLVLPYLEPFLIKSFKRALPYVRDPKLKENMVLFNKQEAQHFKQHQQYNEVICSHYPELAALEERLQQDYDAFLKDKDLKFNIGYCEGFEAITTGLSLAALDDGICQRTTGAAGDMFRWHFMEEIEHRTVAFDVYQNLFGGYFYRAKMSVFVLRHIGSFVMDAMSIMLKQDKERIALEFGGKKGAKERLKLFLRTELGPFVRALLHPLRPAYSPYKIQIPEHILKLSEKYSAEAVEILC